MNWVNVEAADFLEWETLRETLAEGIRVVAKPETTGARVYPNWVYEIDVNSMLGKVTSLMRATTGTDAGKVNCWTIGISSAIVQKGQQTNMPDIIGGYQWKWILTIDVWGIFENDGTKGAQKKAENLARLLSATLWRNNTEVVASVPNLSKLTFLDFTSINPSPFSDGSSQIVAAGVMQAEISESIEF